VILFVVCVYAPATPGSESIWLWIGTIGMTLGMLYFIARGWGVTDKEQQRFYVLTIFIPATAAVSYFAMATGFGLTEIDVAGETLSIYWARYADWLITTPLLLIDLALLAQASRNTIYTLVGLDVLMIVTGLIGALAQTPAIRNRLVGSQHCTVGVPLVRPRPVAQRGRQQTDRVGAEPHHDAP